jgi:hypothetical protein
MAEKRGPAHAMEAAAPDTAAARHRGLGHEEQRASQRKGGQGYNFSRHRGLSRW